MLWEREILEIKEQLINLVVKNKRTNRNPQNLFFKLKIIKDFKLKEKDEEFNLKRKFFITEAEVPNEKIPNKPLCIVGIINSIFVIAIAIMTGIYKGTSKRCIISLLLCLFSCCSQFKSG